MKQSDRIRYCKEYHNHPLRKEYEMKKAQISTKMPLIYYILKIPKFFIIIYLIMAILTFYFSYNGNMQDISWTLFWGTIVAGIINLVVLCPLSFFWSDSCEEKWARKRNKEDFIKLEKEYAQKGLYEMTEQQLYEHECCEYDDYREMYVCCATKQPLSYKDVNFCEQPGNCKYCRAFVTAYLGPDGPEYWLYEFER